jgi:hypothetical protein
MPLKPYRDADDPDFAAEIDTYNEAKRIFDTAGDSVKRVALPELCLKLENILRKKQERWDRENNKNIIEELEYLLSTSGRLGEVIPGLAGLYDNYSKIQACHQEDAIPDSPVFKQESSPPSPCHC